MCSAWMKNYASLIATRLVLGVLEAALTPCLFLWITAFYQRDELDRLSMPALSPDRSYMQEGTYQLNRHRTHIEQIDRKTRGKEVWRR